MMRTRRHSALDLWAAYEGVPVLVFGATGFIGQRMVRALHTLGALVTATARDAALLRRLRASDSHFTVEACDVTRSADVASLIRRVEPAVTFNLAGYGVDRSERDEVAAHRINTELPAHLARMIPALRTSGWVGQSLVHVGSALEYGEARGDLREDTPPQATTLYGKSKLKGTLAVAEQSQQTGLPALTARLFTVYGPGELAGRLLPALLDVAQTREPLALTAGTQRRDFTFVDDVVEGLLRLGTVTTVEPGAVVNLATGRLESVRNFAERAARVIGIPSELLRFGAIPARGDDMAHDPVSVERLRALTNWIPATPIEEGVRQTLQQTTSINANV